MIRRNFLKGISLVGAGSLLTATNAATADAVPQDTERQFWISMLTKIAEPVLKALSQNKLKELMPVEALPDAKEGRKKFSHLEAFGRTMAGLAPWLALGPGATGEGKLRERYIQLSVAALKNAVNPSAQDFMNFNQAGQPLVDAAFLAHALLRAPNTLWENLDTATQKNVIAALVSTRAIKAFNNNWLLFAAMIEAALLKFSRDHYNPAPVDHALKQHEEWYKGDGVYGDGPHFHFDYYNSFVIHPMMLDVVLTMHQTLGGQEKLLKMLLKRSERYAQIQERLISPEGTFPPVGRSLAYRCGAFQLLAQTALQGRLPDSLRPGQVRGALSAVIRRTLEAPGTFDGNGWLTIGFCGHQPGIGETYISTGSAYLCTVVFLPLGLPETDAFWTAAPVDWTSKKAFAGKDFPIDKAIF